MKLPNQFILYRFPKGEEFLFEEIEKSTKDDFTFQIQSFDKKRDLFFKSSGVKNIPISDFKPDIFDEVNVGLAEINLRQTRKEEYLQRCNHFIEKIKKGEFEKLVLSRVFKAKQEENLGKVFEKLTQKYPNALVYLLKFEDEIWMGATPEVLLEVERDELRTMALAGTRDIKAKRDWSPKEKHEHQVVVDYICTSLAEINPVIEQTKTITLGNIQHLMTPIHAKWQQGYSIANIISKLQPTPAICGIPKKEAFDFILGNEGYNRSFYSGLIGWKTENYIKYYVNLRCARVFADEMAVFVGGGITEGSVPASEWEETRLKGEALIKV